MPACKHPTIISESGRAVVAYHSALVFNVLGVSGLGDSDVPNEPPKDVEQPILDLYDALNNLTPATCWKATTTRSRPWTWR